LNTICTVPASAAGTKAGATAAANVVVVGGSVVVVVGGSVVVVDPSMLASLASGRAGDSAGAVFVLL
jgi:hypothetical protein